MYVSACKHTPTVAALFPAFTRVHCATTIVQFSSHTLSVVVTLSIVVGMFGFKVVVLAPLICTNVVNPLLEYDVVDPFRCTLKLLLAGVTLLTYGSGQEFVL